MNKRNEARIPHRPPQWSASYKEDTKLRSKTSKGAFNRERGRYGAGKRRKPRYTREEVHGWEFQMKKDKYWVGEAQRKDKGLNRAGKLAYLKQLRADWNEDILKARKESWIIKEKT